MRRLLIPFLFLLLVLSPLLCSGDGGGWQGQYFNEHTDQEKSAPTDGQVYKWDAAQNLWVLGTVAAAGGNSWTAAGDTGAGFLVGDAAETVTLKGAVAPGLSVSAASNVWTVSQTKADATTNGYLWSTDHVAFNAKALPWTIAGTTGADLIGNTAETWTLAGAGGISFAESGNTMTATWTSASQTWAGNTITVAKGGFGLDTTTWTGVGVVGGGTWTVIGLGTAGQVFAMNATANGYNWTAAVAGGSEATTVSDTATINMTLTGVDVKGDVIALKDLVTTAPLTGGTDNIIPGADSDITIAIPVATTVANGYLWSTDWTTFNAKQAALGYTPAYQWTIQGTTGADLIGNAAEIWTITGETASGHSVAESGNVATVNQTKASTTVNGYLWSTDFNTFNDKMAGTLLKDLVTTAPLTGGTNDILVGADSDITIALPVATNIANGYLWSTDWDTFNNKMAGTLAGDLVTTAPITGGVNDIFPGSGTKATIAIPVATTSANGYLWSTDWTTFNAKAVPWTIQGTSGADLIGNAGEIWSIVGAGGNSTAEASNIMTITWTSAGLGWTGTAIDNIHGGTGDNSSGWTGIPKVTSGDWTLATVSTDYGIAWTATADSGTGVRVGDTNESWTLNGGTNGIDTLVGATGWTINLDTTEITGAVFGAGAQQVWTIDLATDVVVTWTTGTMNLSGDMTLGGGNINTGNIPLVIGDATTDSISFSVDGTGDAEFVVPTASIGAAEGGTGADTSAWTTGVVSISGTAWTVFQESKGFQLSGTVSTASDYGTLWKVPYAATIKSVNVTATGGTAWSIVGQLDECDANGANCAGVDSADITCTSGTNAADDGTLSNPSIDANDWIGWHTTSTTWTTGGVVGVTFNFKYN